MTFLFKIEYYSIVWSLPIHLSLDTQVAPVFHLTTVDDASANTAYKYLFRTPRSVLLEIYPEVGPLSYGNSMFNLFGDSNSVFHSG